MAFQISFYLFSYLEYLNNRCGGIGFEKLFVVDGCAVRCKGRALENCVQGLLLGDFRNNVVVNVFVETSNKVVAVYYEIRLAVYLLFFDFCGQFYA